MLQLSLPCMKKVVGQDIDLLFLTIRNLFRTGSFSFLFFSTTAMIGRDHWPFIQGGFDQWAGFGSLSNRLVCKLCSLHQSGKRRKWQVLQVNTIVANHAMRQTFPGSGCNNPVLFHGIFSFMHPGLSLDIGVRMNSAKVYSTAKEFGTEKRYKVLLIVHQT